MRLPRQVAFLEHGHVTPVGANKAEKKSKKVAQLDRRAGSHSLSCSAARRAGSSSGTPLGGGGSTDPSGAASRDSHRSPCPLPGVGRPRPSLCFDDGLAASPRPLPLPWLLPPSPLLVASPRPRPLPWLPLSPLPRPRPLPLSPPLPWLPLPPPPASPRPAPFPRREPLEPLLGAPATEPASDEVAPATGILCEVRGVNDTGRLQ